MKDTVSIAIRPPTVAEQVQILAGRLGDLEHEVGSLKAKYRLLVKKASVGTAAGEPVVSVLEKGLR